MTVIAESFLVGPAYTSGLLHIRLKDSVRQRYRKLGVPQDNYEFVIDANRVLKVKRATSNGKLMSLAERLRYGPFARFAVITNQPVITNLLSSLIPIIDERLAEVDCWHLLTYSLEWQVASSERFYCYFLRDRHVISTFDVMGAIASAIRAEYIAYLHDPATAPAKPLPLTPLDHVTLNEFVIPPINQRIAHMGITLRRFYAKSTPELQTTGTNSLDAQAIISALLNLNPYGQHSRSPQSSRPLLHATLIHGLLSHLCYELAPDKQWLAQVWRFCGFDLAFDELQSALTGTASPLLADRLSIKQYIRRFVSGRHQTPSVAVLTSALSPVSVVQRLHDAGLEQLRTANQPTGQALQRQPRWRQKALNFFELALLLADSPLLTESEAVFKQKLCVALFAHIQSLSNLVAQRNRTMAFLPDSTILFATDGLERQPMQAMKLPILSSQQLQDEPLELALLLDGYWLASVEPAQDELTGLPLLVELLGRLDALKNLTKRRLFLHPVIVLDEHIAQDFLAAYGVLPCLYTQAAAPTETTKQLLVEWLQPWLEQWHTWVIKPYPVDTDISFEKGFHYLRHLKWQTTHPMQRALVIIGRSRPHEHVKYFPDLAMQEPLYPQPFLDPFTIPYDPADRFSVTDIDWREDLSNLRQSVGIILALCDPGLPNSSYQLPTGHLLFREYQEFWATVDPATLLDVRNADLTQAAEVGITRVLQTLGTQLFQYNQVSYGESLNDLLLTRSNGK